ncbi:MAG: DNA gyrase/topoisomerase IV subunit A, partial [Saprospiraceae bacterium]|nr:DNA gyrase/topoisomerase IV subunit A [Saprospiraceae bacterium]
MSASNGSETDVKVIPIDEMYEEYFLDYASYVILERAVPTINDGLKPVQRRILYSLREKDDGRYHKVANIIGHTMQYHPHGDAAIGDAMVKIGQKELMIDTQGNWGDNRTGDSAAAPRYIEARLTKFALEVAFNKQTTQWQLSYDGRNQEPINLPMKFPLLLAQGTEGIAVGLSTKILPHNFIELIKASIRILEDKNIKIYPDFQTGGLIDVAEYNRGKRGGKVKVRSRIEVVDKNTLSIKELPFGVTTTNLIDSVIKANDKGQIKIKKITDNTAKDVDIQVDLASGISPEVTMDALYAFTNCQVSISPNACVIIDNKPHFLTVEEILKASTMQTKELLRQELEIRRKELEGKWHLSSLEKIFIENRIYRDIEEAESFEAAIKIIEIGLKKYVRTPNDTAAKDDDRLLLKREITEDDIIHLTEIKIRRISKYNKFKHDELMAKLVAELEQVNYDLAHLTDYAIAYFNNLLEKYGKGKERKTEITNLETIQAVTVVANNTKLYVDRKEGFIGNGSAMKKEEFVTECSDIDNIIA